VDQKWSADQALETTVLDKQNICISRAPKGRNDDQQKVSIKNVIRCNERDVKKAFKNM
jgi:hypothetical protein